MEGWNPGVRRSNSRSRTSRPTTPLRPSSRSSFRESARSSAQQDAPFPLNSFEPAFAELADSMADLEANLMHFQLMHESLARFSESFASFMYGMNMNAFCVDFPEVWSFVALLQSPSWPSCWKIGQVSFHPCHKPRDKRIILKSHLLMPDLRFVTVTRERARARRVGWRDNIYDYRRIVCGQPQLSNAELKICNAGASGQASSGPRHSGHARYARRKGRAFKGI
ncbi:hypothetical protein jhhlp_002621 [Lomentospora prolificans]|uniref:DASH complex subunit DAM1 n=1 Tax=Lomentospora prolificans TaxID=41688 RepID=A0A2N3NEK8_9PEZI|nr:hypothetical protein jhhlp_002621 [Lomentospora prolificans]